MRKTPATLFFRGQGFRRRGVDDDVELAFVFFRIVSDARRTHVSVFCRDQRCCVAIVVGSYCTGNVSLVLSSLQTVTRFVLIHRKCTVLVDFSNSLACLILKYDDATFERCAIVILDRARHGRIAATGEKKTGQE